MTNNKFKIEKTHFHNLPAHQANLIIQINHKQSNFVAIRILHQTLKHLLYEKLTRIFHDFRYNNKMHFNSLFFTDQKTL